jgi:hypothetical protein
MFLAASCVTAMTDDTSTSQNPSVSICRFMLTSPLLRNEQEAPFAQPNKVQMNCRYGGSECLFCCYLRLIVDWALRFSVFI